MLKTEDVQRQLKDIVVNVEPRFGLLSGCRYRFEDGRPMCIIGHLLSRLEPEVFEAIDSSNNGKFFQMMVNDGEVEVESQRLKYSLALLQKLQDVGMAWERAIENSRVLELTP